MNKSIFERKKWLGYRWDCGAPADGVLEGVDLHKVGEERQDVLYAHRALGALQQRCDRADALRLQDGTGGNGGLAS